MPATTLRGHGSGVVIRRTHASALLARNRDPVTTLSAFLAVPHSPVVALAAHQAMKRTIELYPSAVLTAQREPIHSVKIFAVTKQIAVIGKREPNQSHLLLVCVLSALALHNGLERLELLVEIRAVCKCV